MKNLIRISLGLALMLVGMYLTYSYANKSSNTLDKPYQVELDEHGIKKGELERVMNQPEYKKYLKSLKDPKDKELFKKITKHKLKVSQDLIHDFKNKEDAIRWDKELDYSISCLMDHFENPKIPLYELLEFKHTYEEYLRSLRSSRWFAFQTSANANYSKEECYDYYK